MVSRGLWQWHSRPLLPVTTVAVMAAVLWVCFSGTEPFRGPGFVPSAFFVGYAFIVSTLLGRFSSSHGEFLLTRGYQPQTVNRMRLGVIFAHSASVWLAASLPLWIGLRSWTQEHIVGSPEYPLLDGVDWLIPFWWLVTLVPLSALLHYERVRGCQPVRGRAGPAWLIAGWLMAAAFVCSSPSTPVAVWTLRIVPALITVVALWAASRLMSQMEVQD